MDAKQTEHHQALLFAARDALRCGHIDNVPKAAARLDARLQDSLGLNAGLAAAICEACDLIPDGAAKALWLDKYSLWLRASAI